ncbi:MAG: zinc/iron-chelating protein [Planctomycetaceae bacterium]|nr:zinc/iron-chelating protein [Planctomycetaceae bacterium]
MPTFSADRLLAEAPAAGFNCGDCTACCTVLAVTELNKPMRLSCSHICRDGCRIYLDRPTGCRQFNCLWLRGALQNCAVQGDAPADVENSINEALRPDHSGVIWDYFVAGTDRQPCLAAFEVWTDAFKRSDILEYLKSICDQSPVRLSFRDGEWAQVAGRDELMSLLESRSNDLSVPRS